VNPPASGDCCGGNSHEKRIDSFASPAPEDRFGNHRKDLFGTRQDRDVLNDILADSLSCTPACVLLDDQSPSWLANLQQRVQMIRHPAERVQPSVLLLDHLRDDLVQPIPISLTPEQGFAMIAPQDHMIEPAGHMQTWRSGHPCLVTSIE
jgi:hypothetical protein